MDKFKVPRKLKKRIKNSIIVYDLASIPREISGEKLLTIFRKTGILFYDSEKGEKPEFFNKSSINFNGK